VLDWDDLQFFLALARHGTLSAAGRALRVAQPTVGRRIAALETRLGAQLFEHSPAGYTLTETGSAMLGHVERMQEHALYAETLASGSSAGITGEVRITASEWVVITLLGPALGPLLSAHPKLRLELIADPRHLSLVKREADIALRPSRFTHQEIVQREVATLEFGLYASESYLARHGEPDFTRGCETHTFIHMSDGLANLVDYEWLQPLAAKARGVVKTNGREPMAVMAAAGLGITVLPCVVGDAKPELRKLATPAPSPRRKLYLGFHRAARSTARVQVTARFIAATLRARLASPPDRY
jgi:DNA-binding transcriptional LysR family regulator